MGEEVETKTETNMVKAGKGKSAKAKVFPTKAKAKKEVKKVIKKRKKTPAFGSLSVNMLSKKKKISDKLLTKDIKEKDADLSTTKTKKEGKRKKIEKERKEEKE